MRKFRRLGTPQKGFLMSEEMINNLFKPPKEYEKKDRENRTNSETDEINDSRLTRNDGFNEDLFI